MRFLFSTVAKYISTGLNSFLDVFSSRSNTTGGLGTSTSGNNWEPINGLINVVSGAAKASTVPTAYTAGSQYPLSAVKMSKSDVNIKLKDTNQGSTAAIWVKSSDEWWGITSRAVQQTIPGNPNYSLFNGPDGGNFSYYTYYWYNSVGNNSYTGEISNVTGSTLVAYFVYGFVSTIYYGVGSYGVAYGANYASRYNTKYSVSYTKYQFTYYNVNYRANGTNWSYRVNSTYYKYVPNYTSYNYTQYGYYNFLGSSTYLVTQPNYTFYYAADGGSNATTYATQQYVDIIRSVAGGSISTISSWLVSTAQTIKSIIVATSGTTITTKVYSDNNFVSQIGSDLVYNATGAIVDTRFGISISPSSYLQSDIIATSAQIDIV